MDVAMSHSSEKMTREIRFSELDTKVIDIRDDFLSFFLKTRYFTLLPFTAHLRAKYCKTIENSRAYKYEGYGKNVQTKVAEH